ncbi:hypothetical protein [Pelagibacterium lentulum]|uniref:Uncharacterized protein n=1 Tax=Pelagibacterium lentulum TaxID=2029865 RepID=A0A916RCE8_9HYPH|nr:hypothetical protein [Pelagibacterium lentulum]GGA51781.1 hypothetical protein GCM10011499_22270 [Pelagibacterium lentulum]
MLQLASALAAISPTLNTYLQEEGNRQRQHYEDLAARRLAGMTNEEAERRYREGSLQDLDNPWYQAAFMKSLGQRLAFDRQNQLSRIYETDFDKRNGDFGSLIAEQSAADLETYGDNRFFMEGYGPIMDNYRTRGLATQAEHQTELLHTEARENVFGTFLGVAHDGIREGHTPEEIHQSIRALFSGNQQFLHMSFREQDEEMLKVASQLAEEGHYELVQEILRGNRTGADGTELGPLVENRAHSARAYQILTRAQNVRAGNDHDATWDLWSDIQRRARDGTITEEELREIREENPNLMTREQYQSILRISEGEQMKREAALLEAETEAAYQMAYNGERRARLGNDLQELEAGRLGYLEDIEVIGPDGKPKTITGDDRAAEVLDYYSMELANRVADGEITEDDRFALEVTAYATSGMTNDRWKIPLTHGYAAASSMTTAGGGDWPPAVAEGIELYNRLRAIDPRYVNTIIGSNEQEFFESIRVSEADLGMTRDQALSFAMADQGTQSGNPYHTITIRDVEDALRGSNARQFSFMGFGPGDVRNLGEASDAIVRYAQRYSRLGKDEAIRRGVEAFNNNYQIINGWAVHASGRSVPAQFSQYAGDYARYYVRNWMADGEVLDEQDVILIPAPMGSDTWMLFDVSMMAPVANPERRYITPRTLMEHQETVAAERALRQDREINARSMARDLNMLPQGGAPGHYYQNNQVYRVDFEDGSTEPIFVPATRGAQGSWITDPPEWLRD